MRIDKHKDVFVLTMTEGENCWNTTFTRAFAQALDEIEQSSGPAALVTASDNPKFFSNGLDLEWISSDGEHPGGDRKAFGSETMALFARLMTFPIWRKCGHQWRARPRLYVAPPRPVRPRP